MRYMAILSVIKVTLGEHWTGTAGKSFKSAFLD